MQPNDFRPAQQGDRAGAVSAGSGETRPSHRARIAESLSDRRPIRGRGSDRTLRVCGRDYWTSPGLRLQLSGRIASPRFSPKAVTTLKRFSDVAIYELLLIALFVLVLGRTILRHAQLLQSF